MRAIYTTEPVMIDHRPIPGGTAFVLPARELPRALGAVLLVAGLVIASFLCFWMAVPLGVLDQRFAPPPVRSEGVV